MLGPQVSWLPAELTWWKTLTEGCRAGFSYNSANAERQEESGCQDEMRKHSCQLPPKTRSQAPALKGEELKKGLTEAGEDRACTLCFKTIFRSCPHSHETGRCHGLAPGHMLYGFSSPETMTWSGNTSVMARISGAQFVYGIYNNLRCKKTYLTRIKSMLCINYLGLLSHHLITYMGVVSICNHRFLSSVPGGLAPIRNSQKGVTQTHLCPSLSSVQHSSHSKL
ncbi:uncharacterized protein LOC111093333 isoform X13 [Canis lupus familiaris]|uniref:uncharacterized protein LOC111093333 isoform X13 n=1 Tax=Canis lupus familiaris TaxID=9615 RepID=UPI0018F3E4AD|nr:uncharacterized protein LOC111093333 isoform X13 [Canis lupus familiaris]XP_038436261.1 uncharacterized protein LOC111093333 isoform X13 [Canis lupus familiaris]